MLAFIALYIFVLQNDLQGLESQCRLNIVMSIMHRPNPMTQTFCY